MIAHRERGCQDGGAGCFGEKSGGWVLWGWWPKAGGVWGWWPQNAPAPTTKHSHKPASDPIPFPPQGIKIRRRHHPTKGRETPRRESDPPEAPCQANRKEGAGATGHLTRLLGAIPPKNQPPNQASSNQALRLRLSPKQKNRTQAVQAASGERPPSD